MCPRSSLIPFFWKTVLLWRLSVAGSNETFLGLEHRHRKMHESAATDDSKTVGSADGRKSSMRNTVVCFSLKSWVLSIISISPLRICYLLSIYCDEIYQKI